MFDAGGAMDMTKPTVAFRSFAEASKNEKRYTKTPCIRLYVVHKRRTSLLLLLLLLLLNHLLI
jgi:hypothetical protein